MRPTFSLVLLLLLLALEHCNTRHGFMVHGMTPSVLAPDQLLPGQHPRQGQRLRRMHANIFLQPTPVAMCTCARNAWPDLHEWIGYHKEVLEVQRFYVYDHDSDAAMLPPLTPLVKQGTVVYSYFTFVDQDVAKLPVFYANTNCLRHYGHLHSFMAFLDMDEFIVMRGPQPQPSLIELLRRYAAFGGLSLNWLQFGSNDHIDRPDEGVIGNYAQCAPNTHVKTIVNVKYAQVGGMFHTHNIVYEDGKSSVDTSTRPVSAHWASQVSPPLLDIAVIHHYTTKSRSEFQAKMQLGSHDLIKKGWDYFEAVNRECDPANAQVLHCDALVKYKGRFVYQNASSQPAG